MQPVQADASTMVNDTVTEHIGCHAGVQCLQLKLCASLGSCNSASVVVITFQAVWERLLLHENILPQLSTSPVRRPSLTLFHTSSSGYGSQHTLGWSLAIHPPLPRQCSIIKQQRSIKPCTTAVLSWVELKSSGGGDLLAAALAIAGPTTLTRRASIACHLAYCGPAQRTL
jgi:hypothetical protein